MNFNVDKLTARRILPAATPAKPVAIVKAEVKTEDKQVSALMARIAELEAKLNPSAIRVTDKGALSVMTGIGKYPVSLYRDQWQRVIDMLPDIVDALAENPEVLTLKQYLDAKRQSGE